MRNIVTVGIVLGRTDFGEADKIITFITPDYGKVKVVARGVRKSKSKMAGGVELFSVTEFSFIKGKGELNTLTSTRLQVHYGNIVKQLDRTQVAYDMLGAVNKTTDEMPDSDYFEILKIGLSTLDNNELKPDVVWLWFMMHLMRLSGHNPNLVSDVDGEDLQSNASYDFALSQMSFIQSPAGQFSSNHIKFLRLSASSSHPKLIQQVQGCDALLSDIKPLVQAMLKTFVRV